MTIQPRAQRLRRAIPLAIGVVALAGPAAAHAGTVSVDGGNLTYTASNGVANGTYVTRPYGNDATTLLIQDSGEDVTTSSPDCEAVQYGVQCSNVTGTVTVNLGDRDDSFGQPSGDEISNPLVVHGGPGNDKIEAWNSGSGNSVLFGDEGSDKLTGHDNNDEMHGGAGDDTLDGAGGSDTLLGDDGNDTFTSDDANKDATPDVIDGGAGSDTISGWTRPQGNDNPPINISLDGIANDGRPGEGDNVVNVELMTSTVSGTFSFSDADDIVSVYSNLDYGASTIATFGGNDTVTGGNYDETIDAGAGNDRIDAGYGNDTITGGPGRDTIYADKASSDCGILQSCNLPQGNDTVYAQDGEQDTISCGVGTDTVYADAIDTVAPDCENVIRGGAGAQPAGKTQAGRGSANSAGSDAKTDSAGRPKPAMTLSARRRGGRLVVSGKLPAKLKGAKVTLKLTAKGKTISSKTAKIGKTGSFSARLATHGKHKLTLTASIAATKTTAATAKTLAVK